MEWKTGGKNQGTIKKGKTDLKNNQIEYPEIKNVVTKIKHIIDG